MTYLPQRPRRKLDIELVLKVCPQCLGDLVVSTDFSGQHYRCLQCNERMEPRSGIGRLPDFADDSFPGADKVSHEVLMA